MSPKYVLNPKNFWLTASLCILLILSMFALGYALHAQTQQTAKERKDLCGAENQSRSDLRKIIILAQASTKRQHRLTTDAKIFYRLALDQTQPIDCSKIGN